MSWLLLALIAVISLASWGGATVFSVACLSLVWVLLGFAKKDLKTPRGFGAWCLWLFWAAAMGLMSGEPGLSAGTVIRPVTGLLTLVLAYSWWGRAQRRAWIVMVWALAIGSAIAALRGGMLGPAAIGLLAAGVGSSSFVIFARSSDPGRWRQGAISVLLILIGLSAGLFVRFGPIAMDDRVQAWKDGVSVAAANPLTGTGPGLFDRGLRLAAGPRRGWVRFSTADSARNDIIQAAAETGLVGLALLMTAFGFSSSRFWGVKVSWEQRAAQGVLMGAAVVCFFESIIATPGLTLLWFSSLAISAGHRDVEELGVSRPPRWLAPLGAAACVFSLMPALWIQTRSFDPHDLDRAARWAPNDPELKAELAVWDLMEDPPQWGRALDRLRTASKLSPANAVFRFQMAQLYAAQGAWQETLTLAQEAVSLEPHFAAADLLLCEIFVDAGDFRRAKVHWERMNTTLAAGYIPSDDYQSWLLDVAPERVAALSRVLSPVP